MPEPVSTNASPTREVAEDAAREMYEASRSIIRAMEILRLAKPSAKSKRPDTRPPSFKAAEAMLDAARQLANNARDEIERDHGFRV